MKCFNRLEKQIASLKLLLVFALFLFFSCSIKDPPKPNIIFVFADQWRAQDIGYNGNKIVKTPTINKLSEESVVFTNAVSGCPVCCPYRASLLTGQYPLTHGVFYNDKALNPGANSIAKIYKQAGYETGYIGKWHLNGHDPGEETFEARLKFIPKERRQGFDFWQVLECTHDYNNSYYYEDSPERLKWEEYDAIAQTKSAIGYINEKSKGENPFLLMLSWGPPHAPYQTAPEKYRQMFSPEDIEIRPNVPDELRETARKEIAGYYAHIAALDDCMKELLLAVEKSGIAENTIFVFTSDHGDMLRSHGMVKKQKPWDESLIVPFLLRYPEKLGKAQKLIEMPVNTPDILPTLLGFSEIEIPETVEGTDFSKVILGERGDENEAVLIQCPVPFHQWNYEKGGREYRGVRTKRFTYVRDLTGPWLLYDNILDPFQMNNLLGADEYIFIQSDLESQLKELLQKTNDNFLSGDEYMKMWNHDWDRNDSIKVQENWL
ncbi:MAG: sulfatase [Prolixibacteraceae bacterium]|jgi:arylsulfatase A-like enzyme|nr:sulfatase [Prolixibacteraceae bacterium]MBT6764866.1 sulfatase [Prolixibacteraceae bacterium]MBT6997108.1 sulfatase [Prolixibacteraceae bacterium]MBT7393359.1 sulfatase [Prolixibacteraceae bacterium]